MDNEQRKRLKLTLLEKSVFTSKNDYDFFFDLGPKEVEHSEDETPLWNDSEELIESEDDVHENVKRDLRKEFTKNNPTPSWMEKQECSDEEYFKSNNMPVIRSYNSDRAYAMVHFISPIINASRRAVSMMDINAKLKLMVTVDGSKCVRVYKVSKSRNLINYDIQLPNRCIYAQFSEESIIMVNGDNCEIIILDCMTKKHVQIHKTKAARCESYGRILVGKKYIAIYGDPDNKNVVKNRGFIDLFDTVSKRYARSIKINDPLIVAAQFTFDHKHLLLLAKNGNLYVWELASFRCINKLQDFGAFQSQSLSLAKDHSYFAIGSLTGYVNIYKFEDLMEKYPSPFKVLDNITTPISVLKFSPDSRFLFYASNCKQSSLKIWVKEKNMIACNWPLKSSDVGTVSHVGFMNDCFVIANLEKQIKLYRME